jgi:putative AdoMet-dependent methyltransferase
MNQMLKPCGQLYIHDVISEGDRAMENIENFVEKQAAAGGDFLRDDVKGHFREEHSTYDWFMDGLMSRAGFTIKRKTIHGGVIGRYLCAKNANDARSRLQATDPSMID